MSITISWVHAVVTGFGALYVQLTEPSLFYSVENLMGRSSETARFFILVSLAYFIYDFLDMLLWSDYSGIDN